jgi:PAS domain S-box-containing protein
VLAFGLGFGASVVAGRYLLGRVADPVLVEQQRREAEHRAVVLEREQALALARAEQARLTQEAQFRAIFDHAPDALLVVDASARVRSANGPAQALWPEVVGGTLPDGLAPAPGRSAEALRLHQHQAPGEAEPVELEVREVPLPLGDQQGSLVLARDITRQRRAEREREEALARVEAALADREVLIQEVHHRVKNNLQMVCGLLEMQSSVLESPAREALRESVARVRAMAIVHEMLYSHDDLSSIDLGSYARSMVTQLRDAVAADAELSFALEPVQLPMARAIPCGLILSELVTNALKHGRSADGRCRLDLAVVRTDGGFLLRVSDSGPGVPGGLKAKPRSLGARVVQALVKQLGGTLTHEDRDGARFEVAVPDPG